MSNNDEDKSSSSSSISIVVNMDTSGSSSPSATEAVAATLLAATNKRSSTILDEEEAESTYVGKKVKQKRSLANMATTPTTPTDGVLSLQTSQQPQQQQQSIAAPTTTTTTTKSSSQQNGENSRSSSTNSPANSPGNISSSSLSSDPRHMDAADTLMSLAHSATTTPTVESKPFPSTNSITSSTLAKLQAQHDLQQQQQQQQPAEPANIEICVSTANENDEGMEKTINLEEITKMAAGSSSSSLQVESKTGGDQQQAAKDMVESACKLLLEQVLKKYPNVNLSSITIKTTTTKPSDKASETTSVIKPPTSLDIESNSSNKSDGGANKSRFENTAISMASASTTTISPSSQSSLSSSSSFSSSSTANVESNAIDNAAKRMRTGNDENNVNVENNKNTNKMTSEAVPKRVVDLNNNVIINTNNANNTAPTRTLIKMEDSRHGYGDEEDNDDDDLASQSGSESNLTKRATSRRNRHNVSKVSSDGDSVYSSTRPAPTLATGRKSKDIVLPPDEAKKRLERRERNKEAAARCRRRREDLTLNLTEKTAALRKEQENLRRQFEELLQEKSRLENIWRAHEKTCHPNHHHQHNQHNHSQNIVKVMKREELHDIIKQQNQSEKHQQQQQQQQQQQTRPPLIQTPQQQQQSHSIVRLNSIGNQNPNNLSIQTSLNEHDKNSLNLMLLQAANSALLTPNSAFANNSLETLLNQIDQQQQQQPVKSPLSHQAPNNLESVIDATHQTSLSSSSNSGIVSSSSSNSTLQRPNNLNLRGGGNVAIGLNATPTPASLFLAMINSAGLNSSGSMQSAGTTTTGGPQPFSFLSQSKLLQTPTIQLNTPTLLALTPIEATLSAFANTPILGAAAGIPQSQQHQQ